MTDSTSTLERTGRSIVAGTWGCAAIVMIASAINAAIVYSAGDNRVLGLATGVAVDVALWVSLVGDRQLASHGLVSGWGRALRYATFGMSLVLNSAVAFQEGHYFRAFLHSFLTLIMVGITEYYQDGLIKLAGLVQARQTTTSNDTEQAIAARAERAELELAESRRDRDRINTELIQTQASLTRELERKGPPVVGYAAERVTSFPTTDDHPGAESTYPVSCRPGSALTTDSNTLSTNGHAKTVTPEEKTAWVRKHLTAGEKVTGAMADREFPGSPRNGARIVRTVKQELENEPKLRSVAAGER